MEVQSVEEAYRDLVRWVDEQGMPDTGPKRQVNVRVPAYVYAGLVKLAERVGEPPGTMAQNLLTWAVERVYFDQTGNVLVPDSLVYPKGPLHVEEGDNVAIVEESEVRK